MARTKKTTRKQVGRRGISRYPREWQALLQNLDDEAGPSQPREVEPEDARMKEPMIEESTDEEDPSEDSQPENDNEPEGEETPDAEPEGQHEEDEDEDEGHHNSEDDPEEDDPNEEEVPEEMEEDPMEIEEVPADEEEGFDPILDEAPNGGDDHNEMEEEAVEEVIDPVLIEDPPPQPINEQMLVQGVQLTAQLRVQNGQLRELYHENHHQRNIIIQQDQRLAYYETEIGGTYRKCQRFVRETHHGLYRKVEAAMDENGKIDGALVLRMIMEAEEELIGRL